MKKLVVALLALSWVACGEEDPPPPPTNTCTPAESNSTKCDGTNLLRCDGTVWNLVENCATTNKICKVVAGLTGVARCEVEVEPADAFEVCSTAVPCEGDLTCLELNPSFLTASYCVQECDPTGANTCGAGICDPMFEYCVTPTGTFAESCGLNGIGCSGTLTCEDYNADVAALACAQECPYAELGTAGSCPTVSDGTTQLQTECLPGIYVDVQDNGGADQTCLEANVGTSTGCDGANGYVCNRVNTQTGTQFLCSRPTTRCALPIPPNTDFREATWGVDGTECGFPGVACKAAGIGTSRCESSGYIMVELESQTACVSDGDCTGGGKCLEFSTAKYCVVTCTRDDGCTFADGFSCMETNVGNLCSFPSAYCIEECEDTGDCAANHTCTRPVVNCADNDATCKLTGNTSFFPFPEIHFTGTNPTTCIGDGDCDQTPVGTEDDYRCIDFTQLSSSLGKYCARSRKVCVAN